MPAGSSFRHRSRGRAALPATPTPAPERRAAAAGRCTPRRSRGTLKDGRCRPEPASQAERRRFESGHPLSRQEAKSVHNTSVHGPWSKIGLRAQLQNCPEPFVSARHPSGLRPSATLESPTRQRAERPSQLAKPQPHRGGHPCPGGGDAGGPTDRLLGLSGGVPVLQPASRNWCARPGNRGGVTVVAALPFDKHHWIKAGKVFAVCGNTFRMLAASRLAPHFSHQRFQPLRPVRGCGAGCLRYVISF
jgi:hypothetical protein